MDGFLFQLLRQRQRPCAQFLRRQRAEFILHRHRAGVFDHFFRLAVGVISEHHFDRRTQLAGTHLFQ